MDKSFLPIKLKHRIKRRPEQALQIACAKWLGALEHAQKKKQFTFYHVPNGGYRTPKEGRVFKDMGLKPGVPDIVLLFPCERYTNGEQVYHGRRPKTVYVELKVGNVAESDNQQDWAALLSDYGFEAHLLRVEDVGFQSLNFAINFFQKLLRDNGVQC